jgi:lipopolysaccharide export system protein LptC
MSPAGIELNLPDLPEVPIQIGGSPAEPPRPRPPVSWGTRMRDVLTTYLPLLTMLALALGTWWLVKSAPRPPAPREQAAPRSEPDYEMAGFSIERFAADGRLKLRIEGAHMRHLPDVDRLEIEQVTLLAFASDGRRIDARAQRALANGDGTEVQLMGGATVRGQTPDGASVEVDSEFLHAFLDTERVRSHLPVRVKVGRDEVHAAGMELDNLGRRLELKGPMRGVLAPRAGASAKESG